MMYGDTTTHGHVTEVTTATGFSVEYFDTYKWMIIFRSPISPGQVVNNTIAGELYVLTPCGATPPAAELYPDATFFSTPLYSVSVLETIPYAFLEILGVTSRVYDVSEYVVAPCGQRLVEDCGRVAPDNYQNATLLEETIMQATDAAISSEVTGYPESLIFSASEDPSALGRAEWVKYLGLFFNLDRYSSAVYAAIAAEYKKTSAAAAAEHAVPRKVAWIQHYVYEGEENYQISFSQYRAELTTAAAGEMVDEAEVAEIPGVQPVPFAENDYQFAWGTNGTFDSREEALDAFWQMLMDVDVVIDETYALDPLAYNLTSFEEQYSIPEDADVMPKTFPWYVSGRIFREDGLLSASMGLDWYEGALARPSTVLKDLVSAFFAPDPATKPFVWIRNIAQTPTVVTAASCKASNGQSCDATPAVICPFVSFCPDGSSTPLVGGATPTDTNTVNGKCEYVPCP
ncbi:hypothetical protein H632_c133p3 [Helicosporidium sp. ATCC 50920]|nr:hypothetical protein H632_c133p3 [Helicosporidium sp. ATCC 50920]|eukprot:KDD76706.1 hypothetical protein H632_c133p3 [Helicosporidium sp. ATCC 50920]